jgi:hypothetical protein
MWHALVPHQMDKAVSAQPAWITNGKKPARLDVTWPNTHEMGWKAG